MMLASDHAAQPGEVTFDAVDMDSIEKAVRVRVVDPLEVESSCKLIPVRGLVGDDLAALGNLRSDETHALGFVLHDTCHRATVALTQGDDAAPVTCPMFLEAPIDAIRARIGWTDMPSDIAAVDLYRPLEHQAVRLARKGFPDFVSENERRLVGKPRAFARAGEAMRPSRR